MGATRSTARGTSQPPRHSGQARRAVGLRRLHCQLAPHRRSAARQSLDQIGQRLPVLLVQHLLQQRLALRQHRLGRVGLVGQGLQLQ